MLVSLTSLDEARQLLNERGVSLNVKTVRAIAYQLATRVRLLQRLDGITFKEQLAGRRVVISTDGGRVRIRRRPQRKTANGRHHYGTDWREPKLVIIYVVDERGTLDHAFTPIIDGTLGDADAIFAWIAYYLRQLIRGGWVVGYQSGKQHLLPGGEVAWEDDRILYVWSMRASTKS